jgi:hypothetical protein
MKDPAGFVPDELRGRIKQERSHDQRRTPGDQTVNGAEFPAQRLRFRCREPPRSVRARHEAKIPVPIGRLVELEPHAENLGQNVRKRLRVEGPFFLGPSRNTSVRYHVRDRDAEVLV